MKKIGIFAGTFDPVHEGHIAFSLAAAQECGLEKVYLLPEREPRTKYNVTDFASRVELLEQAVHTSPILDILELTDKNFTVANTLPQLLQTFKDAHIVLLIGSDIACGSLLHWNQLGELLDQVELVIGVRKNNSTEEVKATMQKIAADHPHLRYTVIPSPLAAISSSQLRSR